MRDGAEPDAPVRLARALVGVSTAPDDSKFPTGRVNGRASMLDSAQWVSSRSLAEEAVDGLLQRNGRTPERWVRVDVVEAYIHCSKHIPHLARRPDSQQAWGTDDPVRKGGDYF